MQDLTAKLAAASPLLLMSMLALPFIGSALLLLVDNAKRRLAAWSAGIVTLAAFALLMAMSLQAFDGQIVRSSVEWLPSLGVGFGLRMDGLAYMFSLLILGIGALVVLYAAYYLDAEDPPARFFAFLLLFMGAMLGVVLADNLILLVVFWELTSISSFLLIGYWRHREDAREGARMALAVTGMGGLALLGGVLLIGHVVGSYQLDVVLGAREVLQASPWYIPALLLVLLGAFTKSAQFPFHFWLPRAMAAPTPVSAYLHSATMVKAGVFLLARLYPLLGGSDAWFWIVSTAGLTTLLMGAVIAIFQHDLKGLLAYSTVSHLGLITLLFGLDSQLAVVAGVFHIINHATFKASLFMAAGIIDHEAGTRDMRDLNCLWDHMPYTATLAMVACAAMAGVPLLNGFLSKEMLFVETVSLEGRGIMELAAPIAATLAGIAGVAYSLRFIHDVFFHGSRVPEDPVAAANAPGSTAHEPPRFMRVPVELLVVLCLAVGIFPNLFVGPLLAVAATATLNGVLPEYSLAVWHGFNTALVMSLIAIAGGTGLYFLLQKRFNLHAIEKLPGDAKLLFDALIDNLTVASQWITARTQNGSLQMYLFWIVLATLAAAGWGASQMAANAVDPAAVPASSMAAANAAELTVLFIGAAALAGTVALHRSRLTALVLMGTVGLVVSLAFIYFSAPDLALTQISVEVVSVILLMLALKHLPGEGRPEAHPVRKLRDAGIAIASGAGVTWVLYQVLMRPVDSMSPYFLETAIPQGGGSNVVNVILVDYRGFDTLGEIVVLGLAGMIVAVLLGRLRDVSPATEPASVTSENDRHPLMLTVISTLLLPLALLVSFYIFLRGHNLPGGGFIAGLVFAIAVFLQYVALGRRKAEALLPIDAARWTGWGLLAASLTGLGSFVVAHPFLTSSHATFTLPILGGVPIASAMFFDLGVYLVVIGGTLLALSSLARLKDNRATRAAAGVNA